MTWHSAGLMAVFDGDKGAVFTVLLVGLLIAGVILLVVNLSMRPRAPAWEAIPDDEPEAAEPEPQPAAARAPRRRA